MRFRNLLHNVVAHPIAGLCWFIGFDATGDHVHTWWT